MKMSYLIYGAMALTILLVVVAAGLLQNRVSPLQGATRVAGAAPSQQQLLERRRGAIGTAAVAGTTAQ